MQQFHCVVLLVCSLRWRYWRTSTREWCINWLLDAHGSGPMMRWRWTALRQRPLKDRSTQPHMQVLHQLMKLAMMTSCDTVGTARYRSNDRNRLCFSSLYYAGVPRSVVDDETDGNMAVQNRTRGLILVSFAKTSTILTIELLHG